MKYFNALLSFLFLLSGCGGEETVSRSLEIQVNGTVNGIGTNPFFRAPDSLLRLSVSDDTYRVSTSEVSPNAIKQMRFNKREGDNFPALDIQMKPFMEDLIRRDLEWAEITGHEISASEVFYIPATFYFGQVDGQGRAIGFTETLEFRVVSLKKQIRPRQIYTEWCSGSETQQQAGDGPALQLEFNDSILVNGETLQLDLTIDVGLLLNIHQSAGWGC